MRIIIVQAEIELAIRQYILTQIAVKEGQDISIEFKNTRGDDGATAEINIQAPAPNEPQKPVQSRSLPAATKVTPTTISAAAAPAVVATEAITSENEQSADTASTTTEAETVVEEAPVPSFIQKGMEDATASDEATEAADPAPTPSKSLFGNLTRPVNTKAE